MSYYFHFNTIFYKEEKMCQDKPNFNQRYKKIITTEYSINRKYIKGKRKLYLPLEELFIMFYFL